VLTTSGVSVSDAHKPVLRDVNLVVGIRQGRDRRHLRLGQDHAGIADDMTVINAGYHDEKRMHVSTR
jgi:hypothetical protein